MEFVNVDETVLTQAQRLMEKYKLGPRDAIHIACALVRKTRCIISDDEDFDKIKEITRVPLL